MSTWSSLSDWARWHICNIECSQPDQDKVNSFHSFMTVQRSPRVIVCPHCGETHQK